MRLTQQFFKRNRETLISDSGHALYVLTSYELMQRSNDMAFKFYQEANFWYLTGINEPGWTLIIDAQQNRDILVAPYVDEVHRIFEGGITPEAAIRLSGADMVITQEEMEPLL